MLGAGPGARTSGAAVRTLHPVRPLPQGRGVTRSLAVRATSRPRGGGCLYRRRRGRLIRRCARRRGWRGWRPRGRAGSTGLVGRCGFGPPTRPYHTVVVRHDSRMQRQVLAFISGDEDGSGYPGGQLGELVLVADGAVETAVLVLPDALHETFCGEGSENCIDVGQRRRPHGQASTRSKAGTNRTEGVEGEVVPACCTVDVRLFQGPGSSRAPARPEATPRPDRPRRRRPPAVDSLPPPFQGRSRRRRQDLRSHHRPGQRYAPPTPAPPW